MLWQFFSLPGIENGIEYRYFSRYRIEVRNSSIVTTLECTKSENSPTYGVEAKDLWELWEAGEEAGKRRVQRLQKYHAGVRVHLTHELFTRF